MREGLIPYKLIDAHGIRFDLVLLDIPEQVRFRWNARVDTVTLCGHSGGGQFAHRFHYLHPDRLASVRKVEIPGVGHDATGTRPSITDFFTELLADNAGHVESGPAAGR